MESRGRGRATKETIRFGGEVIEREREKKEWQFWDVRGVCKKKKGEFGGEREKAGKGGLVQKEHNKTQIAGRR